MALHNQEQNSGTNQVRNQDDHQVTSFARVNADVEQNSHSARNGAPASVKERGDHPNTLTYEPAAADHQSAPPRNESVRTRDGYTISDEGRMNNYPISPEPYRQERPRFGFTEVAERWNGRLAMVGFVALIITEWIAGESLVSLLTSG